MNNEELHVNIINPTEIFAINRYDDLNIQVHQIFNCKILVIDNIFFDVNKVKEYALSLPYHNNIALTGNAPVFRAMTQPCSIFNSTILNLVQKNLDDSIIFDTTETVFSYQSKEMLNHLKFMTPHRDWGEDYDMNYAGVIYLTNNCGTSFFKYDLDFYTDESIAVTNFYPEQYMKHFHEIGNVEGISNRFVVYDSQLLHRPDYSRVSDFPYRIIQNFQFIKKSLDN